MKIDAKLVKQLRDLSGAGVMDAKNSLLKAGGDIKKAQELLKQQGQALASRRSGRSTGAGMVDVYLHMGRVGAMVEINCETDFVAKTTEFKDFTHEIAMQVASMNPSYLSSQDIPSSVLDQARQDITAELKAGSSGNEDKIIAGKLAKFYAERCLMQQPSIKDPKITIETKLQELISKLGENIQIKRFVRYELGGDSE